MDGIKKPKDRQWTEIDKSECAVLKQMAKYQFNAPLKVTLILEESNTEGYERPIEDSVKTKDKNSNVTSETISASQILQQAKYLNSIKFSKDTKRMIQNTNQQQVPALSIEQKEIRILLDSISKNLIRIMHLRYETFNNNYDRLMFEKAKNNYLEFKKNIFEKSYVITKSLILPKEADYVFIEKFIRRTLEIAYNIIPYRHIPRELLRELLINTIMDLINWTKQKVLVTSKTLTKLDHNVLTSAMNMAPLNTETQQLNNINCMSYNCNVTTGQNIRNMNGHPINKYQSVNNKLPTKRISSVTIPEEENTIVASKRQKVTYNKDNYNNISQTSTQNYTINNYFMEKELVNSNNNLNIDHQSSAVRSVSRDSGIGSPICTNWPSDEMHVDWNAHVSNRGR